MFSKKEEKYLGRGVLEGIVLTHPHTKVTAFAARLAIDYVGRVNAYLCRVYQTESHLIIRWRYVLTFPTKKILLQNCAVERYFIFAKDPRLVVLAVTVQCSQRCAYILIRMKNSELAHGVCNSIEERRAASHNSTFFPVPEKFYEAKQENAEYLKTIVRQRDTESEFRFSKTFHLDKRSRYTTQCKKEMLQSHSKKCFKSESDINKATNVLSPDEQECQEETALGEVSLFSVSKSTDNLLVIKHSFGNAKAVEFSEKKKPAVKVDDKSVTERRIVQNSDIIDIKEEILSQSYGRKEKIQERRGFAEEKQTYNRGIGNERCMKHAIDKRKYKTQANIRPASSQPSETVIIVSTNSSVEIQDESRELHEYEDNYICVPNENTRFIKSLHRELCRGLHKEDWAVQFDVIQESCAGSGDTLIFSAHHLGPNIPGLC